MFILYPPSFNKSINQSIMFISVRKPVYIHILTIKQLQLFFTGRTVLVVLVVSMVSL